MKVNTEIITGVINVEYNENKNKCLIDYVSKFREVRSYIQSVEIIFSDNNCTSLLIRIIARSRKKTNFIKKDIMSTINKIYGKEFITFCTVNRIVNLGTIND